MLLVCHRSWSCEGIIVVPKPRSYFSRTLLFYFLGFCDLGCGFNGEFMLWRHYINSSPRGAFLWSSSSKWRQKHEALWMFWHRDQPLYRNISALPNSVFSSIALFLFAIISLWDGKCILLFVVVPLQRVTSSVDELFGIAYVIFNGLLKCICRLFLWGPWYSSVARSVVQLTTQVHRTIFFSSSCQNLSIILKNF